MLLELVLLGGVVGLAVSCVGAAHRLGGGTGDPEPEAALRELLSGPEASAVRAEFRRRGLGERPSMGYRPVNPAGPWLA
jgi:hypothetical protein